MQGTEWEQEQAAAAVVSDLGFAMMESHPNLASYLRRGTAAAGQSRPDMIDMVDGAKSASDVDVRRDPSMMGIRHELPADYLAGEKARTLGTFDGVFMYVAVSIFGVVLFTRMGWLVAFGGLGLSILIVIIAAFVTLVTTASVSALVTNGKIMAGGPYVLVARSVGLEFGSVVGIFYALAQIVSIALNDVGFAESVTDLYATASGAGAFTGSKSTDTMIIAQVSHARFILLLHLEASFI
jgi:hypothetical protein